jgi:large subunit ribosomal protein L9
MEVILLERIEKLGQMGDLVTVKPGFARNFLLPQKKAVTATKENKIEFENQRGHLEAQNIKEKSEAQKIATKLEGQKILMVRQAGDAGQLYGSVSVRNIADGMIESGFSVNRNQIKLENPIKTIGMHPVLVTLHPEVSTSIQVNVARSKEEAKIQDKTGIAVISNGDETDTVAELVTELDSDESNMPSETEADDQAKAAQAASVQDTTEELLGTSEGTNAPIAEN